MLTTVGFCLLLHLCVSAAPAEPEPARRVPLPVRYETVRAQPGFIPTGEVVRSERGLEIACMVFKPGVDGGVSERNWTANVLWEVDTNQFHHWSNSPSNKKIENAQPTADEHAMVLRHSKNRLTVWHGWSNVEHVLEVPKDVEATYCNALKLLPDGRVVGQISLKANEHYASVWDAQGEPRLIGKPGYESLHAVDASGDYVVGDAWPITNDHLTHYAFAWHFETGTTILPLPKGSSNATGVAVNADGLVLLSARFYENEERGAKRWHDRPFLWTAESGLVPLPYPGGHSARALGMNEMGQVFMECFKPEDLTEDNDDARASRHYCVVTIDGQGPVKLPRAFDDATRLYTHQALGDSGAVGVHAVWYEPAEEGGRTAIKHRGAVLLPVYEDSPDQSEQEE